jgi:predicted DNA-binding transcriptional regulator YafY
LQRDPRDLPSARWPQPPCSNSNCGSSIAAALLGWYLDAWDDDKDALRSFAIDRIRRATVLPDTALDIPEAQLDEHYASAYGIFGGKADKVAVLVFTAERARWVADERWHPQQEGRWLEDGRYELRIPYREARELVMDVLRHGAAVVVLQPTELRDVVIEETQRVAAQYSGPHQQLDVDPATHNC